MRSTVAVVGVLMAAATTVQCSSPDTSTAPAPPAATTPAAPAVRPNPGASPEFATTVTAPPDVPTPATVFPVTAAELGATWRPGCPVAPEDLRRVSLDYVGFDGTTHRGDLVVHRDRVDAVIDVFGELYRLRFPIERMQTVDHYPGAQDELSMRDDNTSAFNCRDLPNGGFSQHAMGRAVDVNPLRNPYLSGSGDLQPATAGEWLDRSRSDPGLLHDGDPYVTAFTARGWTWGGHWRDPKDYQHFEMP